MIKRIVYFLAALHLSVVALTILHLLDNEKTYGLLEQPLSCLTAINYSAWRFGFFTPNVGSSTHLDLVLSNEAGDSVVYSTADDFEFFTRHHESANRFYGHKVHSTKDSVFLDLSARSLCAYALNEHPDMTRIKLSMRGIRYPTMQHFTQDSAIIREEFYRVSFRLAP